MKPTKTMYFLIHFTARSLVVIFKKRKIYKSECNTYLRSSLKDINFDKHVILPIVDTKLSLNASRSS